MLTWKRSALTAKHNPYRASDQLEGAVSNGLYLILPVQAGLPSGRQGSRLIYQVSWLPYSQGGRRHYWIADGVDLKQAKDAANADAAKKQRVAVRDNPTQSPNGLMLVGALAALTAGAFLIGKAVQAAIAPPTTQPLFQQGGPDVYDV